MTENNLARDRFRAAYENRYTWDEQFPGYTTDLELKQGEGSSPEFDSGRGVQGAEVNSAHSRSACEPREEVYTANIRVNSDLSVEVTGIEDEQVKESVYNQMRDIITHRKRNSFENAHGKSTFSLGEEDASGAVEILVKGDAMGSNYKIRGTEICQVSRVMGPIAFVINTNESLDTGNGYVSTGYNAIFRDSKTNELKGKREFKESYEKFGNYYLPTEQIIESIDKDGQKITTEFIFSNIKLLEPATVA